MTQPEAFILVGGRSSRLGTDKALIEFGGETLTHRAVSIVRQGLSPERITIVAGSSLQFASDAIAADVPFIFDVYENRGPLGGIHAALAHARAPWIFILACDYPFVSSELLKLLATDVSDEFGAVVPEQEDGRLQPLCGFYNVAIVRPIVEEILERPRVPPPMHEIVHSLNPLIVRFDEYSSLPGVERMFSNINTSSDLDEARKIERKLSGET